MGAVANAEAASVELIGVVVLSEQAASKTAPATRSEQKILFMCVSQKFLRLVADSRKTFW
jgi:hypothetical protein